MEGQHEALQKEIKNVYINFVWFTQGVMQVRTETACEDKQRTFTHKAFCVLSKNKLLMSSFNLHNVPSMLISY